MKVITAPAGNVYGTRRIPNDIDPKKEIPVRIEFNSFDLTTKNGYIITPMDGLFRKAVEKLNIPIKKIDLALPRSSSFPPVYGSPPLDFWAGNGNFYDLEKVKPFCSYQRHLFLGQSVFDEMERVTGRLRLSDLMSLVRGDPIGETLTFSIGDMDLSLHMGYDYSTALFETLKTRDPRHGFKNELEVSILTPELQKYGKPSLKIDLEGKGGEEAVKIAEEILDNYIPRRPTPPYQQA